MKLDSIGLWAESRLVKSIHAHPDSPNVSRFEAEINKLVYDLYALTPDEIEIVEDSQ